MRNLIIYTAFVFISLKADAQTIQIKGIVTDTHGTPLTFASVFIKNETDSKPLSGDIADIDGKFKLTVSTQGTYRLQVSLVNYQTWQKDIRITKDTKLDSIILETTSHTLAEVSIKGTKPLVTKKTDRYIVNVAENSLATGKSAIELFDLAPGVFANSFGISINGNSSTKVMIDGRLLKLDNAALLTYLSGLKADQISSIEVIPHPSAAYDAEGTGGIINIILKRNKSEGLNGSITLGYQQPDFPSFYGNGALNYRDKGWEFYANYSYNKTNSTTSLEDSRAQNGSTYNSNAVIKPRNINNNFQIGTGYDISTNQFIGIEFNGSLNNNQTNTTSLANINDVLTPLYRQINGNFGSKVNSNLYDASLNYKWKTDTLGSSFKVLADYVYNPHTSNGNYQSVYTGVDNIFLLDSVYRNQVNNNIKNYALSVDFNKVLKNKSSVDAGLKFTDTKTSNDILYENLEQGNYVIDPLQSDNYNYRENIAAAYGEYDTRWLQTDIQAGLRGELTNTRGADVSGSAIVSNRNYFNLFPAIFLQHALNKVSSLSFNFGRRIDRPTFNTLDPFVRKVDDYTYISGNPDLRPQYTNTYSLSYNYHDYSVSLFIYNTHDVFDQLLLNSSDQNSVVAQYQWTNLSTQNVFGVSFYLPFQITTWWNMINSFVFVRSVYDYSDVVNQKNIALLKTLQSFSISSTFKVDLSGFYQSAYNMGNLNFRPNYYVDFGLNKSFSNSKYNVKLGVSDVFNTSRADYSTNAGGLELSEKQKYLTRIISLQLIYKFGGNKDSHTKRVESGNGDEKDRMK